MKFDFLKMACIAAVACSPLFAQEDYVEYFDCWLEDVTNLIPSERSRIGAEGDANICGCFRIREKGQWGGRSGERQVTKVWNIPKPRVTPCSGSACRDEGAMKQCVDYIQSSSASLKDFATNHPMDGAVAMTFGNDGWTNTPFGEYYEQHKDKAKDIDCFFNIHERPDVAPDDRSHPENFTFSGMPKKLVPSAVGRFTDNSDIRCLDNGELTGFAFNGYKENLRHVDKEGLLQGEEVGYLNDPSYPVRQDSSWGKVSWTATHKNGMREGVATFYKSNVMDRNSQKYYFKHLEVPYKQGFKDGTARMFAENGFLMADIPLKRDGIHGRMVVNNPFKKKKITLTFNANQLEGFVDFGDFGGVYHNGLPNGLITFWAVQDTCYQWMPGQKVCYTERYKKTQWGTYKMGKFQGTMECWNGKKGGVDLVCPPLPADSVKLTPAAKDSIARLEKAAAAGDTAAMAALHQGKLKTLKEKVIQAREAAAQARQTAEKAREEAAKADAEAKKAEQAAKQAEEAAAQAEEELSQEESVGTNPKKKSSKKNKKEKNSKKKPSKGRP